MSADSTDGWRASVLRLHDHSARKARREGPHVASSMVLGHKMRRAIHQISSNRHSQFINSATVADFDIAHADRSPIQLARELRRSLTEEQELVLLVVCQGAIWQSVDSMISCLRADYLPRKHPVIVVSQTVPPPNALHDYGSSVVVIDGDCLDSITLMEAGMLQAREVIIMTGEPKTGSQSGLMDKDMRAILCAHETECWCGISAKEIFATFELHEGISVNQLPKLYNRPISDVDELLQKHTSQSEGADSDSDSNDLGCESADIRSSHVIISDNGAASLISKHTGLSATAVKRSSSERGGHVPHEDTKSTLFHSRFAAGQIFTPELWGVMLGQMYYTPAVIELVEALAMGHRKDQHAFPWQIRVPKKLVGQTLCVMFRAMVMGRFDRQCDEESKTARRSSTVSSTPIPEASQAPASAMVGIARQFQPPTAAESDERNPSKGSIDSSSAGRPSPTFDLNGGKQPSGEPNESHSMVTIGDISQISFEAAKSKELDDSLLRNSSEATFDSKGDDGLPKRFSSKDSNGQPKIGSSGEATDNGAQQPRTSTAGPAVPLALYRTRDDIGPEALITEHTSGTARGTGSYYYNILAPEPETVLRGTDWVLVLGSRRFGKRMARLGLLRSGMTADAPAAGNYERNFGPANIWHDTPDSVPMPDPESPPQMTEESV